MVQPQAGPPPVGRPGARPPKTRLGRILAERPEERPRLARAVGGLLAVTLATVAVLGVLLIWHLRRRAGLIRERLALRGGVAPHDLEPTDPDAEADEGGAGSSPLDSR
jgi:hypothetical protein